MNLMHAASLVDSCVDGHVDSLHVDSLAVGLAAAGPDLPVAARVVLGLVLVLALLSAAARYRRPSSKD
ncbi:hypothetical protein ACH4SP_14400 [Streptomyces sp. NPDC021093]|uniref:hypothetical protein n=1 Tax=Streptomyces sp. NPDC021093 TaxID=3365112 RepID=UPI0037A1CE92